MHSESKSSHWNRRGFLQAGALGFFGLDLPGWLRAQEARPVRPATSKAKACILIYLDGGMSHIDTFDMKPDAPLEYRGEFKTVASRLVGAPVCEHLPRIANILDRCSLVRSLGQRGQGIMGDAHHTGAYYYLTGHVPDVSFGQLALNRKPRGEDWPFIGSVVALKKGTSAALPLVALPDWAHSAEYIRAGQFGGLLGTPYDPFRILGDVDRPSQFTVPNLSLPDDVPASRLQERRSLLERFERDRPLESSAEAYGRHHQRAYSLLSSAVRAGAFDLNREPRRVRERYGNEFNCQSMLMARRLVEAGVPFVSVNWKRNPSDIPGCSGWDTHRANFRCLKNYLLPLLDQGYSALIEDLDQRGLLDETLVVLVSEMGRTPRIGDPRPGGFDGRDHWVHCQTAILAGGGIGRGHILGSSDRTAAYPLTRAVGPEDLAATIYHALGITDLMGQTREGRQVHLLESGEPMHELFA